MQYEYCNYRSHKIENLVGQDRLVDCQRMVQYRVDDLYSSQRRMRNPNNKYNSKFKNENKN